MALRDPLPAALTLSLALLALRSAIAVPRPVFHLMSHQHVACGAVVLCDGDVNLADAAAVQVRVIWQTGTCRRLVIWPWSVGPMRGTRTAWMKPVTVR